MIFQHEKRSVYCKWDKTKCYCFLSKAVRSRQRLLPGGVIPPHDGSGPVHIAFAMRTAEAEQWVKHLKAHGVDIESRVDWERMS